MESVAMADIERLKKHCLEYNVLEKMHNDLCNALPIDDLFPSMITNHVIDFIAKGDICAESRTERGRVQFFLERYLYPRLLLMETNRFYDFLAVMEKSSKCDFLVKRINHWIEQYRDYSAKPLQSTMEDQSKMSSPAHPPVATSTTTTATEQSTGATITAAVAPVPVSATAISSSTTFISCDDCLVTGKASRSCMMLMKKLVIPVITDEWEKVAIFLEYSIEEKNNIKGTYSTPKDCCVALIEDWLSTDKGLQPKTWKSLIEALSETEDLVSTAKEIKQSLMSEGVSFEVNPVQDSHDRKEYAEESPVPTAPHTLTTNPTNEQGRITAPTEETVAEAHECLDDLRQLNNSTSPFPPSSPITTTTATTISGITTTTFGGVTAVHDGATATPTNVTTHAITNTTMVTPTKVATAPINVTPTPPHVTVRSTPDANGFDYTDMPTKLDDDDQRKSDGNYQSKPVGQSKSDNDPHGGQHILDESDLNLESHEHPESIDDDQSKPDNIDDRPRPSDDNLLDEANEAIDNDQDARNESQLTAESESQLAAESESQFTAESESQLTAESESQLTAESESEGLVQASELEDLADENSCEWISPNDSDTKLLQESTQILLVTANTHEYNAVLSLLEPVKSSLLLKYKHCYNIGPLRKTATYIFGRFGAFNVAVHRMVSQGPAAAQDVITVAASCFGHNLNAIIAVGVACGVENKNDYLDVLVSEKITFYQYARIGTDKDKVVITNRDIANLPTSSFFLDIFNQPPQWPANDKGETVAKLTKKPVLRLGTILSGNKLVDNQQFKNELLENFAPGAIGIEMEGAGLFHNYNDHNYEILVVKGVCDFGDGKKDKRYQPTAALLAAECLRHYLSDDHLPRSLNSHCRRFNPMLKNDHYGYFWKAAWIIAAVVCVIALAETGRAYMRETSLAEIH